MANRCDVVGDHAHEHRLPITVALHLTHVRDEHNLLVLLHMTVDSTVRYNFAVVLIGYAGRQCRWQKGGSMRVNASPAVDLRIGGDLKLL